MVELAHQVERRHVTPEVAGFEARISPHIEGVVAVNALLLFNLALQS